MRDRSELFLSPSLHHWHVLRTTKQEYAYDGGPVAAWQDLLRPRVRDLLGIPREERVPLDPRRLWSDDSPLGTIEKVAFTAEPYADVLAYFCVPNGLEPPYPTVICLQGHSTGMHLSIGRDRHDESRTIEAEGDRDFALGAMRHGFAALCIEQRSFGERAEWRQEQRSHGCHDAAMQALMLGRTLVGERVFDVDRGLDYLAARGDVDMSRVGVMGNSGGGTVAIYAAAVLDRIAFAMPSCAFCSFTDSIMSIYHCADNYIPGLLRLAECADVLGLFAPKPVVVVAGRDDPIFPLHGVRSEFERLRRIYAAAGAPDSCALVVGDGGHRFFEGEAWRALGEVLPLPA